MQLWVVRQFSSSIPPVFYLSEPGKKRQWVFVSLCLVRCCAEGWEIEMSGSRSLLCSPCSEKQAKSDSVWLDDCTCNFLKLPSSWATFLCLWSSPAWFWKEDRTLILLLKPKSLASLSLALEKPQSLRVHTAEGRGWGCGQQPIWGPVMAVPGARDSVRLSLGRHPCYWQLSGISPRLPCMLLQLTHHIFFHLAQKWWFLEQ